MMPRATSSRSTTSSTAGTIRAATPSSIRRAPDSDRDLVRKSTPRSAGAFLFGLSLVDSSYFVKTLMARSRQRVRAKRGPMTGSAASPDDASHRRENHEAPDGPASFETRAGALLR